MEKTLKELKSLLRLAQVHKDFCLTRFREIDRSKKALDARIKALEMQRAPRIGNVIDGVLADKWQKWRKDRLNRLETQRDEIDTIWKNEQNRARQAVGRVEVIQELIRQRATERDRGRARKNEYDLSENAMRLV